MEDGRLAFRRLQPVCHRLLPVLSGDGGTDMLLSELRELASIMTELPPRGLALCWDYILFPLACLLSSATESTKRGASNSRANTELSSKKKLIKRDTSLLQCEGRAVEEKREGEITAVTAVEIEGEGERENLRPLVAVCLSSSSSSPPPSSDCGKLAFQHGSRVGEAALQCMENLLRKCPCDSANKLVFLLPSLMKAAALTREEASEEFRHISVRCLKALLAGLHSPREGLPAEDKRAVDTACDSGDENNHHRGRTQSGRTAHGECPLAALRSEAMGVAVGSLVDLLLKIDEAEVAAGSAGSKSLRTDALGTLKCLVQKLDDADALAYFLPAMSVRLAKAALSHIQGTNGRLIAVPSAQTKVVGAAGSTAAVREAVSLLGDLLILILGDDRNRDAIMADEKDFSQTASGSCQPRGKSEEDTNTVDSVLQALRQLKERGCRETKVWEEKGEEDGAEENGRDVKGKGADVVKEMPAFDGDFRKLVLRVDRNREWLAQTSSKLHILISRSFPLLSLHPSPKVRLALGNTCCRLLTECRLTLKDTVPILLDCLLGLAYDEFPQVSIPMVKVISSIVVLAGGIAGGSNSKDEGYTIPRADTQVKRQKQLWIEREIIESILQRLVAGMEVALHSKDEIFTVLHLKKLASAMMVAGHRLAAASLFGSQPAAERLALALIESFAFARGNAELVSKWVYPSPSPMTSKVAQKPSASPLDAVKTLSKACSPQTAAELSNHQNGANGSVSTAWKEANTQQEADTRRLHDSLEHQDSSLMASADGTHQRDQEHAANNSAIVGELPHMPLGLMYVSSQQVYRAIARVCRFAGKLSIKEGALATAMEPFAAPLRKVIDNISQRKVGQSRRQSSTSGTMDVFIGSTGNVGKLQRTAASAAVVLNEVLYGASAAWFDDHEEILLPVEGRGSSADSSVDLLPFVTTIIREYMSPEIWELPTDAHSSRLLAGVEKGLKVTDSVQGGEEMPLIAEDTGMLEPTPYFVLHDNAILQMVLLEGVAVFARALGTRFVTGGLLASTLQQVLDKLGDGHPLVRQAAKLTLDSICVFCGYPSPRKLIAANADYVVDALCRNMHHLELHPRTPDLFVAVLKQTGAAPDLLPLLREPMAAILRSLEVNWRRRNPQHTLSFLLALRELSNAAEKDLTVVAEKCQVAALQAEKEGARKLEMRRRERRKAAREKKKNRAMTNEKAGDNEQEKNGPVRPSMDEIKKFFLDEDYRQDVLSQEGDSEEDEPKNVSETEEEAGRNGHQEDSQFLSVQFDVEKACMTREDRIRQLSSSAEIVSMSVEASEPLLGSRVIQARIVAMDVVANCMRALAAAEKASTSEKKCVGSLRVILRGETLRGEWSAGLAHLSEDAEVPPALHEACRLLPLVHAVWPETVLCLRHWHHAVVIRALELMCTIIKAAGGHFMMTRIQDDAWPVMEGFLQPSPSARDRRRTLTSRQDLLVLPLAPVSGTPVVNSRGVWSRGAMGYHEGDSMSPDALENVRKAVLEWIIIVATDKESTDALRLVVSSMVDAMKLFVSKGHTKPLQAMASSALSALSKLKFQK